jgi:hypothetical protein
VVEERVRRIHGRTTEQQRRRNRKPFHRHFSSYTKSCRDEREELRIMPVWRIRIAWQGEFSSHRMANTTAISANRSCAAYGNCEEQIGPGELRRR